MEQVALRAIWIIGAILGAYWLAGLALPTTKEDVAAGASDAMPHSHDEYVARFRSVRSSGGSTEDGLAELRAAGADMGDSVKAVREAEGIGLGQAKIILDESATWADLRPTTEWLRDLAEESIRSESDVRDTENGLPDQPTPRRRSRPDSTLLVALPTALGEGLARSVSEALGTTLEAHESSFFGGDYFRGELRNGAEVYLYRNEDPYDGTRFHDEVDQSFTILRLDRGEIAAQELLALMKRRVDSRAVRLG
jgi:hypothetical protein